MKILKTSKEGKQYRKTHSEYITQYRNDNTEKAAEYRRQYYKENAEELIAKKKLYYEANTEQIVEYKKQYYEANAEKLAEQRKLYCEANPEKIAATQKQWREANPERCRLGRQRYRTRKKSLLSDFTMEQWESCLSYFNHEDAYTGLPLNSPSQDHVVPLSKGGGYTVDNIVPCECNTNSSKGNRDMLTWFRKQTYYDAEREKKILAYLA